MKPLIKGVVIGAISVIILIFVLPPIISQISEMKRYYDFDAAYKEKYGDAPGAVDKLGNFCAVSQLTLRGYCDYDLPVRGPPEDPEYYQDTDYQASAKYYAGLGGYKWKNEMYADLEIQKKSKNCSYIENKIIEIDNVASNLVPNTDIWDEVMHVKEAWVRAQGWICN